MNKQFVKKRTIICRICGRKYETESRCRRYCDSPECVAKRLSVKNERRNARRHLLAELGIPIHASGNK